MGNRRGPLSGRPIVVVAPAKLTLSLVVEGRRPDGYHDLRAEMVALDLADVLRIEPGGEGLVLEASPGSRAEEVPSGPTNLVHRALEAVGRRARVHVVKGIPVGGGLGGGSADAAAVLRWAGCHDPAVAASLGADVPFCVTGGRAMVEGLGERVTPLPFEARSFVLLVPPFGVDTGAVYRRFDARSETAAGRRAGADDSRGPGEARGLSVRNDLEVAALEVEPRLAAWRDLLAEVTGRRPVLAGSGSTWFVEGTLAEFGLDGRGSIELGPPDGGHGHLVEAHTVPAGWDGPSG